MISKAEAKSYACYLSDLVHPSHYRHSRRAFPFAPEMQYSTLSRSGLKSSVVGLGSGGPSRLGKAYGKNTKHCVGLIRAAFEAGINFIDTSEAYGTERSVGLAMRPFRREDVIVSTKKLVSYRGRLISAEQLRIGAECSLRRLGSDYIDYYLLHAVAVEDYDQVREALVPALCRLRDQGKIRFLGISEAFTRDPKHSMLSRAVKDDFWDIMLLGFNLTNTSARRIIQEAKRKEVDIVAAFVLRDLWNENTRQVRDSLHRLSEERNLALAELAFRYCLHEPGIDVVLTGTGNPDHLNSNVESCLQAPLSEDLLTRVREEVSQCENEQE